MPDFLKIPEAVDFIAGQAWLSPNEPVMSAAATALPRAARPPKRLRWNVALRDIAAILRRIG